jgi:hypothetical protein
MPTARYLLPVLLSVALAGCIVVVQEAPKPAPRAVVEPPRISGEVAIENPGFEGEDGIIRPWETVVHAAAYSYTFDVAAQSARSGQAGVRLERSGTEPWGGIVQVIDVAAPSGQTGTLRAWIRSPQLDGHVEFFVRVYPVRGAPVYHIKRFEAAQRSEDWQEVQVSFTTDRPIRRVWVGATLYGGERIDLDDFSLSFR